MSQAGELNTAQGPVPPYVATSYVTDVNSPAIPAANILDVFGGTLDINNNNGIQTDGSSGSNVLTIQLTNRIQGTVTTSDATPTTLASFDLGTTPGVYTFDIQISGFDTTDKLGAGFFISGSIRTTGLVGTVCGTPDKIDNLETGLVGPDATLTVSGNDAIIQVTGKAATDINWRTIATYVLVT